MPLDGDPVADRLRPDTSKHALAQAREAGFVAGVTRLADITRLDCIGMPVWQAIRPMSRALSVHQGKGLTHDAARIGALMEAAESFAAENFSRVDASASWDNIDPQCRAGDWADFARDRDAPPSQSATRDWTVAERLNGQQALVPFECVSADYTTMLGTGLDRSSNGLASGFSQQQARLAAMMEVIERDAINEWRRLPMPERMKDAIDLSDIPYEWLGQWYDLLRALGLHLRCYRVRHVTGTPIIAAELSDLGKDAVAYRAMEGMAAHPSVETAMLRAVSEAIQCRCTYIAGSRDDLLQADYRTSPKGVRVVFALAPPPGSRRVAIAEIEDGSADLTALDQAIVTAGFGPVCFVDLGRVGPAFVSKAFVPGFSHATRRRPLAAW